jgi:hypothetical protein
VGECGLPSTNGQRVSHALYKAFKSLIMIIIKQYKPLFEYQDILTGQAVR